MLFAEKIFSEFGKSWDFFVELLTVFLETSKIFLKFAQSNLG